MCLDITEDAHVMATVERTHGRVAINQIPRKSLCLFYIRVDYVPILGYSLFLRWPKLLTTGKRAMKPLRLK